ncbi:T9SS type A sorting domain-containing protein [Tamlana sp. I1]|uniref:T9SS type A sorting domain-containing protein n=1 Tax=Tamlana sp. I1 TaxID=2762061 RepID=UPI001890B3F1|nr:T9SS type A sorting domain-containing protein [Tamlana sp. I1]
MKKNYKQLTILTLLICCFWVLTGYAQTTVTKNYSGPTQEINGCGGPYCADVGSVSFAASDFPAGAVITDVKVSITWQKTAGTCSAPTSEDPTNAEVSFQIVETDSGKNVVLAGQTTWRGTTPGGVVTTIFDDNAATVPSGTPTSGTFKPAEVNTFEGQFKGENPVGTWLLKAGDLLDNNKALCVSSFSVTITANAAPTAVCISGTEMFLDQNGQATLPAHLVDGGSSDPEGGVTLAVSPNTFDCSDIGDQIVTLTVTDAAGETDTCTATVTVSKGDDLAITDAYPEDICHGAAANTGKINVEWVGTAQEVVLTPSGGTATTYNSDLLDGELEITGLEAGNYTLDINGICGQTVTTTIEVKQSDVLAITDVTPKDICYGAGINSGEVDISWDGGVLYFIGIRSTFPGGSSTRAVYDNLENGQTTLYGLRAGTHEITLNDECGKSVTTTVEIKQLDELAITDVYSVDICYGAAANTGKINVEWEGAAQEVVLTPDGGTATTYNLGLENGELEIINLEAGNYTLDVKGICGETVSTTIEVKQSDELAITDATPVDVCFGAGDSTGKIEIAWNGSASFIGVTSVYPDGGTGSRPIYDDLDNGATSLLFFSAGTHTITITNACGESDTTTVEIKQLDELAITDAYPVDICYGAAANTGKINLEWEGAAQEVVLTPDGGTATTYNLGLENGELEIINLEAGNYTLDVNGICGETVSTTIEVKQSDELAITDATPVDVCFGAGDSTGKIEIAWNGSISFIGVTSVYPDGGTGSRPIYDDLDNGATTLLFFSAGTHTITITNACGESDTTTVEIKQLDELAITDAYSLDICYGAAANTGKINVEWEGAAQEVVLTPDGGTATTYNSGLENGELEIINLEAGNYTLDVNGICGETVSTTIEVKQSDELAITSATPSEICYGAGDSTGKIDIEWNGSASFIGVTSVYPDGETGSRPIYDDLDNGSTTLLFLRAGTHTITITNACGESDTTTVEIKQLEELAFTEANASNICFGGAANSGKINIKWVGDAEEITVTFGSTTWNYTDALESGSLTIEPLEADTYTIEILDFCGETVSTTVEVKQLDELAITDATPIDICFGAGNTEGKIDLTWDGGTLDYIGIDSTYPDGGSSGHTFFANLDNGQTTIDGLRAGTHEISLNDKCGKSVTTTVEIKQLEPVITCPPDETVQAAVSGTYMLPDYIADNKVTATDGCGASVSLTQYPVAGTDLGVGKHTITFSIPNGLGAFSCSFELTVEDALSTTDVNSKLHGVLIYPNPASDKVIIRNARQESLKTAKIYDIRGSLVKKVNLSGMGETLDLDISALEGALYLLKVEGENGSKEFKLMVK